MANGFEVISTRLLNTLVSGDGCISGCPCKVLAIFVGNVLALAVFVAFGQAEVNDVDVVAGAFCASNEEVVGLDVSVDDSFLVHFLNAANHLLADQ